MAFLNLPSQSYKWLLAELTVVVIGILIAFQVEEWRTNRNDRLTAYASLDAVLLELNDELAELDQFISTGNGSMDASTILLNSLLDKSPIEKETLQELFPLIRQSRYWGVHDSMYSSLRESGGLNFISDTELKFELFDYYELEEYMLSQNATLMEIRSQFIYVANRDVFRVPRSSNPTSARYSIIEPVSEFPRHPEFVSTLGEFASHIQLFVGNVEELRSRNLDLQKLVSAELEKQ